MSWSVQGIATLNKKGLHSVDLISFNGRIVDCTCTSSCQDLLRSHRIRLHIRTMEFYKTTEK
uniref:Uncharacterized protein n=1 Tax=Lepeophtheirus salmonis TaxID=72036 RepID=A0A0K2UY29_LEPSM